MTPDREPLAEKLNGLAFGFVAAIGTFGLMWLPSVARYFGVF